MNLILLHLIFLLVGMFVLYASRNNNLNQVFYIMICFVSLIFAILISNTIDVAKPNSIDVYNIIQDIPISFGLDFLGIIFLFISNSLWLMVSLFSLSYLKLNSYQEKYKFYFFFTLAMFSTNAIIYSSNILTTFIFYEILTLSTYPLVTFKNNEESLKKGKIYLYYLLGTSIIFFLPAMIITYLISGTLDYTNGGFLQNQDHSILFLLFILYLFGVAKSALMPFHKWLPSAMVAPTPVSALLHAVAVVKSGVFILMKIILLVFGSTTLLSTGLDTVLITLASLTIIISSIIAIYQDNIKLRLAYSTIGQLSYILLATAIMSSYSILAAVLHLIFHALGKVMLFLSAGIITTQTGIKKVSEMDNLSAKLPYTCLVILVGAFIMIGLPPTIGFISKWYLISGIIDSGKINILIIILVSTLLNAGYYFPMIYRSYFKTAPISNVSSVENIGLILPVLLIAVVSVLLFFNVDFIINFINRYIF
ncbi:MAG: cation:proton antiporter [Gammaproteobacteria bacterium]|nr:cation:proton antiporter [Gammaproteobacteria bacterium]|tara:strand:- start:1598 stop:3034 length:1437 start_codon:yes stop_codon:yes gene_type:complete